MDDTINDNLSGVADSFGQDAQLLLAGATARAASFIAPPAAPAVNSTAPNSVQASGQLQGQTLVLVVLGLAALGFIFYRR